ncbi:MAG: zinc ribbon domain-containing protein [Treponema sp.]|nr:zinc ribbon domain-containing protein [Treponema sp.]
MFCRNCGIQADEDAIFCKICGVKLSERNNNKYCFNCGSALDDDAIFCMYCGTKIKENEESTENKENYDKISDSSENSNQNTKFIDYKNAFRNGKHFVYATDSSELLCPNCHKIADPDATLCYNCNTSFLVSNNSSSTNDNNNTEQNEYTIIEKDLKTFAVIKNGNPNNYYCPNCHQQVNPSSDTCSNCNTNFYKYNTNSLDGLSQNDDIISSDNRDLPDEEPRNYALLGGVLGFLAFICFFIWVLNIQS